ncbi:hypothetical protein QZN30_17790 [Burkholderia multivorans]|nr:hypothetical protein [Burkholderia multivorans]
MTIDISKMKALVARVNDCTKPVDAADRNGIMQLVDSLLSELEAAKLERDKMMKALAECRDKVHVEGYGKSFLYEAIACPDYVPAFIGQTVTELRAALEAAAADKRDAERYRWAIALEDNAETLYAAVISCGPRCTESINIEIDAARAPASEGEQK